VPAPSRGAQATARSTITAQGADFAFSSLPASTAKALGFKFGISYLSYSASKDWTQSFWNAYHAAGLKTVLNWEWGCCDAGDGYAVGQQEARQARSEANALGAPSSTPIYFSVDYDARWSQVSAYFAGVKSVLGTRTGVYGSYFIVRSALNAGYKWAWQTYAWSMGAWDTRAQLEQYLNGSTYDHDRATTTDYGQVPRPVKAIRHASGTANATNGRNVSWGYYGVKGTTGSFRSGVEAYWASAYELIGHQGKVSVYPLPKNARQITHPGNYWSSVAEPATRWGEHFNASKGTWLVWQRPHPTPPKFRSNCAFLKVVTGFKLGGKFAGTWRDHRDGLVGCHK
jgi:hypothetical protein